MGHNKKHLKASKRTITVGTNGGNRLGVRTRLVIGGTLAVAVIAAGILVALQITRSNNRANENDQPLSLSTETTDAYYKQQLADTRYAESKTGIYLQQARFALGQKRYDAALAAVQDAVKQSPDDFQAQETLGDIYAAQNKPAEAIKAYEKALALARTQSPDPSMATYYQQKIDDLKGRS